MIMFVKSTIKYSWSILYSRLVKPFNRQGHLSPGHKQWRVLLWIKSFNNIISVIHNTILLYGVVDLTTEAIFHKIFIFTNTLILSLLKHSNIWKDTKKTCLSCMAPAGAMMDSPAWKNKKFFLLIYTDVQKKKKKISYILLPHWCRNSHSIWNCAFQFLIF